MTELLQTCRIWRGECGEGVAEVDNRIMRVQLMLALHNSGSDVQIRWSDFENPARLRRIRDGLVAEDRYTLALDVSTKCKMECASVWADWARALVGMGQYVLCRVIAFACFMCGRRYEAAFEKLRGWAKANGNAQKGAHIEWRFVLYAFPCLTARPLLCAAARRSSDDNKTPHTDAFIDSLIVLVEQAPPLSVEAIETCIAGTNSMVGAAPRSCFWFFIRQFIDPHALEL